MTDPADPQSPCIAVCRLDRRTGVCIGCHRTVDEIQQWPRADASTRRVILDRAAARKTA